MIACGNGLRTSWKERMNAHIKKFFRGVVVFFSGVVSTVLLLWGRGLFNNRKRTESTGDELQEVTGSIAESREGLGEVRDGIADARGAIEENLGIIEEIRKRPTTHN